MNRIVLIHELIEKFELKQVTRRRDVLYKRYFIFNELRNAGYSSMEIGRLFNKTHATILNGFRAHKDLLSYRDVDYVSETRVIAEALEGSEVPKYFKPRGNYNIFYDVLNAQNMITFKRIKRRIKMGLYEEISPEDAKNLQKSPTFVRDRAANTSEIDQKLREGGLLCAEIVSNKQARNS